MIAALRQKRPTIEAKETYYRGKRDLDGGMIAALAQEPVVL
jgi:hypothetical protein